MNETFPHHPTYRIASDMLSLWALCGKPACRRAQACKRDPRSCARRYGPLVPEEARIGMLAALQGAQDGVGIEEVRLYEPTGIAAWESWLAQVEAANGNGQAGETVDHTPEQSHGA